MSSTGSATKEPVVARPVAGPTSARTSAGPAASRTPTKKRVVSGGLQPRWPKPRVVRWLEAGAIPALVGLWLPDWVGGYAAALAGVPPRLPAVPFPPVLAYAGAIILLLACAQGVKGMGSHYRGVLAAGGVAVAAAGGSVALHLLLVPDRLGLAVLVSFLAFAAAVGFVWFTLRKVAEITTERRARRAAAIVAGFAAAALLPAVAATLLALHGDPGWTAPARAAQILFTVSLAAARYGVHCYKTQSSIGATFSTRPAEQFWI